MAGIVVSYELFKNTKVPIKIPVYTYQPKYTVTTITSPTSNEKIEQNKMDIKQVPLYEIHTHTKDSQ